MPDKIDNVLKCYCGEFPHLVSQLYEGGLPNYRYVCPHCGLQHKYRATSKAGAVRDWNLTVSAALGYDRNLCCEICGLPMIVCFADGLRQPNLDIDAEYDRAIQQGYYHEIGFGGWYCPDCARVYGG